MTRRVIIFVILLAVLALGSKKPSPGQTVPQKVIRRFVIPAIFSFGQDKTPVAASAPSSDDGLAPASTDDDGTQGLLTTPPEYPCTCRVCLCKDPNHPLSEEEFDRLQDDLRKAGSTEMGLQMELVSLLCQIDELKKENESLKAKPVAKAAPVVYAAPTARSTYGNSYNYGSNCGPNGCYAPARAFLPWRR